MARPTWKQTAAVAALAGGAALGTAGCSGAGPPSPLPTSGSLPAPPNHNRTVQNLRLGQMPPSIRHFMQRFKGIQIFGTTDGPHEAVGLGIGRVGHKFTIAGFVISTEHDPDIQAVLNTFPSERSGVPPYSDDTSADDGKSHAIRIKEGKYKGMWLIFYEGNNHIPGKAGSDLTAVATAADLPPAPSLRVSITNHGLVNSGMSAGI